MGAGYHGGFGNTYGKEIHKENLQKVEKKQNEQVSLSNSQKKNEVKKSRRQNLFTKKGHITVKRIAARREFFLGKSVVKIESILHKAGYETQRRPSKHSTSKAKIIVTLNPSRERNITQIQISPGSKRHGNVPYIKFSTTDYGKIKVIGASKEKYKTDNKEKAVLLYRRYGK